MKLLLIGSGGREHAMADAFLKNRQVEKIYCAPGNGGTAALEKCENIPLHTVEELLAFAVENAIDFTVVGPEALLAEGIADAFQEAGLKIFGVTKDGAQLESSKAFSKDFMKKYGVRTASYETFTDPNAAKKYLDTITDFPIVIKASGLALGKGVVICNTLEEAKDTVTEMMEDCVFQSAGETIVIEEFLEGVEASILTVVSHSNQIVELQSAKDHKRVFDGDLGDNTGGMGAVCPNPYMDDAAWEAFRKEIVAPTLKGLQEENIDFTGAIFFGLMITAKGIYLLEYNVRFGDPETQAILPMLKSDFLSLLLNAVDGTLMTESLQWKSGCSVCITAVSGGYPKFYVKGVPISGLDTIAENITVYIAGADVNEQGVLCTTGGRVLNVVAHGNTLEEAQEKAYTEIEKIQYAGMFYRKDIGGAREK